ncbi:MAG: PQQ-dependent sugar dehydrogenase [Thermodesulfobacteriota bacterium]
MFTLKKHIIFVIALFFSLDQFTFAQEVSIEPLDKSLKNPTSIANAGDGSGRLFITEQGGKILIFSSNQLLSTPFLDISSKVEDKELEQGLLGLAFHPNYILNGFFYVNYTDKSGSTVVERYTVSSLNPFIADPNSAQTVITYSQPTHSHNGGYIAFGPDGMLYISSGDGGGSPRNRAQETTNLLGKILRIDVESDDFPDDPTANYSIPASNPFSNEIWVLGLRNPWRFSFDQNGNLFIGDVGHRKIEEINFQPSSSPGGENYGWPCFEGNNIFNKCPSINHINPIIAYEHVSNASCSVTGGFRYRGFEIPQLAGKYLFTDYCSGKIWSAAEITPGNWSFSLLIDTPLPITSFGEDENGELYVVDHPFSRNGGLYKIINNDPDDMSSSSCSVAGGGSDKSQILIFLFIFGLFIIRHLFFIRQKTQ